MVSLDIANAFLEGDTDFNNYMFLPEDLTNFLTDNSGEKIRVKLGKSLYGIKQAAKVFNDKLNIHLMSIGFERLHNDVCLYIYDFNKLHKHKMNEEKDSLGSSLSYDENELYYLIIHVDDIIICGKEKYNIEMLLTQIQKGFKRITRSNDVIKYLGIKLNKMKNHYILDQKFYIDKTLNDVFEHETIKDSYIPMTTAVNFRKADCDETNVSLLPILGKIRYITDKSRPDILFATNLLCTKANNPPNVFVEGTIKLLKYLKFSRN
jgi:hypothetical protein